MRTADGKNLFAVEDGKPRADAQYEDTRYISQEAEWFLAGLLEGLEDSKSMIVLSLPYLTRIPVVPLLVPTINGYKRLVGGEVRFLFLALNSP